MKQFILFIGLILVGCKEGKSGDDNSHLRNSQQANSNKIIVRKPESIVINNHLFYKLDRDLLLNKRFVLDTFTLESCYKSISKPDSIIRGGPSIVAEFGVDDYDLFFGKSSISAGHGQILEIKIRDKNLKLQTIGIGSDRTYMQKILKFDFPNKDTVNCLGIGDDFYYFIFNSKNKISKIDYYSATL